MAEPVLRIGVVTRTRDRTSFLQRAAETLAAQTCREFRWVIVNDSGPEEPVEAIAGKARRAGLDVQVIHNHTPQGIEHAANLGVAVVDLDYVMIHDDDDTLEPDFIGKTIHFLDSRPDCVGVITGVNEVQESAGGEDIRILSSRPYVFQPGRVSLDSLGVANRFPPIALVYRRAAYDAVGGYDPDLPVLGDWDFNLRLCHLGPIGVIRERLANYHHREPGSGDFVNNIYVERQQHEAHMDVIRKKYRDLGPAEIADALTRGAPKARRLKAPLRYRANSLRLRLKQRLSGKAGAGSN